LESSPKLVFIHGWGTSSSVWGKQIEHFSKRHEIETADPTSSFTINDKRSTINDFERSTINDQRSTILIGWSYGGMIAMKNCLREPDRFKGLVLVGSTAKFTDESIGMPMAIVKKIKRDLKRDYETAMKNCYRTFFSKEEARHTNGFIGSKLPGKEDSINIVDELMILDLEEELKNINIPTLIIHGDQDEVCPIEAASFLRRGIDKSRFHVIKGAGHMPFLTRADEFNECLEGFINDIK